jgi:hypothetical protein
MLPGLCDSLRFGLPISETAIKKSSFAQYDGSFEFGIFLTGREMFGACLSRESDGKIVDGFVRRFTEVDGLNRFQEMQLRMP